MSDIDDDLANSEDDYEEEEFDYETTNIPEEPNVDIKTCEKFRLNAKKFAFIKYAEFIPANEVSKQIDIGDIIHIIHRSYGYCYVQCIVDYMDAEYASIHRIDMTGYAEKTYKFYHRHFLIFKVPAEYWKTALTNAWKPIIDQLSIDTKESQNELGEE